MGQVNYELRITKLRQKHQIAGKDREKSNTFMYVEFRTFASGIPFQLFPDEKL